ncbi:hypothetical protein Tcan_01082, partial [Toxocara canis]
MVLRKHIKWFFEEWTGYCSGFHFLLELSFMHNEGHFKDFFSLLYKSFWKLSASPLLLMPVCAAVRFRMTESLFRCSFSPASNANLNFALFVIVWNRNLLPWNECLNFKYLYVRLKCCLANAQFLGFFLTSFF